MTYPGPVVSSEWLAAHLHDANVRVVDATVHLPDTGRNAKEEYVAEHIPGAAFFDLERIADPDNPLPRKLPPVEHFAREVGALGIDNRTHVVAYDTPGLYSAARVWWLFRHYGYDNVSILDGGFKNWKAEGRAVEAGSRSYPAAVFTPGESRDLFASWRDVLAASQNAQPQILDARTPGRFAGTEVDRYPGARPGHIPGSRNLYWADLLDAKTRKLLPAAEIADRFAKVGVKSGEPVVISCGSGLTACILALGLHLTGRNDWKVYDGSWDEWGRRQELPVELGPSPA